MMKNYDYEGTRNLSIVTLSNGYHEAVVYEMRTDAYGKVYHHPVDVVVENQNKRKYTKLVNQFGRA